MKENSRCGSHVSREIAAGLKVLGAPSNVLVLRDLRTPVLQVVRLRLVGPVERVHPALLQAVLEVGRKAPEVFGSYTSATCCTRACAWPLHLQPGANAMQRHDKL